MRGRTIAVVLAALLLSILAGVMLGGGVIHTGLALILGIWIGLPALIALVLGIQDRKRKRGQKVLIDGALTGAATYFVCVGAFYCSGAAVFHHREAEVRMFVDGTLPLLDAHKRKFGHYPKELAEVTKMKTPYYFRGRHGYTSDGDTFRFYYEDPNSIMAGLLLTDNHRTWSIAD